MDRQRSSSSIILRYHKKIDLFTEREATIVLYCTFAVCLVQENSGERADLLDAIVRLKRVIPAALRRRGRVEDRMHDVGGGLVRDLGRIRPNGATARQVG